MSDATDQTTNTDLTFGEMQQAALVVERIEEAARALFEEWSNLHRSLAKEFPAYGAPWFEFEGAHERIDYNAYRLDENGITFSGTDRDGDFHAFDIPFVFIDPMTRPACTQGLRARYRRKAEENAERMARRDADRAARARAHLAEEAARLGYALTPIADED